MGPQIVGERFLNFFSPQFTTNCKGNLVLFGKSCWGEPCSAAEVGTELPVPGGMRKALRSSALNNQPRYIGLDVLGSGILVVLHALPGQQRHSEYSFP